MNIEKIIVSPFKTNCYFVYRDGLGVIIDPGGDCEIIYDKLKNLNSVKFLYVINTHGHSDHTFCNKFLKENFNLKILIHEKDSIFLTFNSINKVYEPNFEEVEPDILLKDNDIIDLNLFKMRVFHTPGHTPGSIMLICENIIFSGDTIFKGSIGRTDFEFGNSKKMKESLIKILTELKEDYTIYPGHGEKTTLNSEKDNLKFYLEFL